jgi:hypothetical protein
MKCFNASFNVGKVEVWASELYLNNKSVFEEIEEKTDEIIEQVSSEDDWHTDEEINQAISKMLKDGFYKKDNLDFFCA